MDKLMGLIVIVFVFFYWFISWLFTTLTSGCLFIILTCISPSLRSGNGTVDRVQELLQKTHAAFLNRNFVQGKTSQAGDYYNPFCNI